MPMSFLRMASYCLLGILVRLDRSATTGQDLSDADGNGHAAGPILRPLAITGAIIINHS